MSDAAWAYLRDYPHRVVLVALTLAWLVSVGLRVRRALTRPPGGVD